MTGPAGVDAAILQGARNAADINVLAERLEEVKTRLGQLGTVLEGVQGRVSDQAVILQSADGLAETVDELIRRFNAMFPPGDPSTGFYTPIQTPRFWLLDGEEKAQAVARLRAWVGQVDQPVFGHVAQRLPGGRVNGQVAAWRLTRRRLPACWPGICPGPR